MRLHAQNRGNILFLILLAVVLFAALSYAVTQSMRGGGRDSLSEQAQMAASAIVQYGTNIEQTIGRLMLINDCKDTQISFWTDSNNDGAETTADDYYNAGAPGSKKCHVFHPNGGGAQFDTVNARNLTTPSSPYAAYNQYLFINSTQVVNVGTTCDNETCTDLILYKRHLKKEICDQINQSLNGFAAIDANARSATNHGNYRFRGVYTYYATMDNGKLGATTGNDTAGEARYAGLRSGCFRQIDGVDNDYYYFHVLIAR